jgi:hypothetical protein
MGTISKISVKLLLYIIITFQTLLLFSSRKECHFEICRWLTWNHIIYFLAIKCTTTPNRLSPTRPSPIFPLVSSGTGACRGYYFAKIFRKYPNLKTVYLDSSLSQQSIGCVFLYHDQDYRYSLRYNNRDHTSEINATYRAHPCIRWHFR